MLPILLRLKALGLIRLIVPGSLEQSVEGTVNVSYNLRTVFVKMCYRICLMK